MRSRLPCHALPLPAPALTGHLTPTVSKTLVHFWDPLHQMCSIPTHVPPQDYLLWGVVYGVRLMVGMLASR